MKKKLASKLCKGLVVGAIFLSTVSLSFSHAVKAEEVEVKPDVKITNEKVEGNTESYTLEIEDQEFDFEIVKDDDSFVLTSSTEDEKHKFEYEKGDNYAVMDGEKVELSIENFKEPEFLENTQEPTKQLLKASSPWTPKYMGSGRVNIAKTVKTVLAIATLISGAVGVAALAGVTIAKSVIVQVVSSWASVVGLGSLLDGPVFRGAVTFKQYRTSGLVPTGYGSKKLYAFRYQDIRSVGSVKKKDMNKQLKSAGKWFFNSSPY
ncbi:hypothetical protein HB837_05150 [Listeria innocua]|uniref:hypothetical protein n=1 Tax=Listeria innocua TaxID=1642 RepID=UPI0010DA2488|nr:hypothetical protein [Listeria innocua]MBC1351830.1 hypothetical protein [Listeria innocua]HDT2098820.1 hypothetical protein [Listeria innocua]